MRKALTLYELNQLVKETIEIEMPDEYWVEAELSDIHERGHCYMELIEKDAESNTPIAKARANCWVNRWLIIKSNFENVTHQSLHAGMKVMLKVKASFHEAYGFSWNVTDIDPTFTLGDMAKKRQEIIRQLKDEGVFDLQRELEIPLFAQRIAVISSESAAGYGDFCNQLQDNDYGFVFQTKLFPAIMQGEQVEQSVINALDTINGEVENYDVVVIIRGGGATADLSGFDTLALAENVANFPLPVITGIGHERDESILDMISNVRVKTPTAAAAFLIDHLADVSTRIEEAKQTLLNLVSRRMEYEQMRLARLSDKIPSLFSVFKAQQTSRLDNLYLTISSKVSQKLESKRYRFTSQTAAFYAAINHLLEGRKHQIALLEEKMKALDPQKMLARGYSITLYKGHSVRDARLLKAGEEIETRVEKGTIKSIIK
jgi:exodeoxyribonuclease VII large subunit